MMRIGWLLGALVAAFALAVWASQSPAPVPASAPATEFSAVRAMAGDLAIRMDYDLDAVEDLRLAVDGRVRVGQVAKAVEQIIGQRLIL